MTSPAPIPRGARLPQRTVWINGRLCDPASAMLSVFDRGARDGEGLLETLRVHRGIPFDWDRHMERLVLSAAELGFPVPPAPRALRTAMDEVLAANRLSDAAVRITVTRGIPGGRPTRTGAWVEAQAISERLWNGARTGKARAVLSKVPFEPGHLGRHKTSNRLAYALAREEARAARADEALLVSPDGWLLEGTTSNVFVVLHHEVVTPPLDHGILPGITRRRVIEVAAGTGTNVIERRVPAAGLAEAAEIFLTNSIQEVVPLVDLGGRALPSRRLADRLAAGFRELVERELG